MLLRPGGRPSTLLVCLLLTWLLWGDVRSCFGQRDLKDIPVPDPEIERATFRLPDGFEINLFAADPAIAKPIQMNFDSRGRLWIAMSEVYPHIKPGQEANDKILILEDSDGDGRSDSTTVFVEGLLIPTGVAPGDGGAYVANSTQLLHFCDDNGDGRADRREVVLSGFGTEDTHHILHTLRWGPDGRLYFNQSIYIHSHIETPWGVQRLNGGGIWRYFPPSYELEVFARGFINTWGHHFDQSGQSFATDGAGGEGINYVIPGAAFRTAVGMPRILPGLNPGSPKYCGLEVISGRQLPTDWQGNLITADFRGHRVCRFRLVDDGSGFASNQLPDLISSDHVAFRPIDIKMGPDGAIYIADWYNPIIQHGEVDFRDPRRDHTHGRIWRITYKGQPLVERPKIAAVGASQLFPLLGHPEGWTREQTRRELQERGPELRPALDSWVSGLSAEDPTADTKRLEALWVCESWNTPGVELLDQVLASHDANIRAAGVRVLGHWSGQVPEAQSTLGKFIADPHPRVRLEAVRGLARMPQASSAILAMRALDRPMDSFLNYGLWLTIRDLQAIWVPEIASGRISFDSPQHLDFAVNAVESAAVLPAVLRILEQQPDLPRAQSDPLVESVARLGGPAEAAAILEMALALADTDSARTAELLDVLNSAGRRRGVRPSGDLMAALGTLLQHQDPAVRVAAIRSGGIWKVEQMRAPLIQLATTQDANANVRTAAYRALADLQGTESETVLLEQARVATPLSLRAEALIAVVQFAPQAAAAELAPLLAETTNHALINRLFEAFLARKDGMAVLHEAVNRYGLPADAAKVALRLVTASGRPDPALVASLSQAGGITGQPRKLSAGEMQQWVARVQKSGDAARGEEVFRRESLACVKCHAIGGAGGRVGPDMVSLGGSAQVDYLVESLFDPNAKVKENYHTVVIVDLDGKIHSGVKTGQTDTELILRDSEDREKRIPLDTIDEQSVGVSLMPAGLPDRLTEREMTDLVRFLSEVGRTPGFTVSPRLFARHWQAMFSTTSAADQLRRTSDATAAGDDPAYTWKPIFSRVNGQLPISELPVLTIRNKSASGDRQTAFVRTEFEVHSPQFGQTSAVVPVLLRFDATDGLTGWLDREPLAVARELPVAVPPGRHRLTLAIETQRGLEQLRLELVPDPKSNATVRWVTRE